MTNTEAITKLTNIMHDDHYAWHPSILTAFGMAVDALKGAEGDCISRQDAVEDAREAFKRNPTMAIRVMDLIKSMPPTQPIEPKRKNGRWLPDNNNYITPHFVCSACGMSQKVETVMYEPIWAFCPRCGARMMKEGEAE